jgi:N-acetylglucosaminyl-diphospho-decaprenol L-rhamnosyltransferase
MIYFLTVNYYSTELLKKLISSLLKQEQLEFKLVVVNNSPDDESLEFIRNESVLIFDAESNLGFGNACNLGIRWIYTQDNQAIIWIINPDAFLRENMQFNPQIFFDSHPEVSILGTIIHTPAGKIWFAGGSFFPEVGEIAEQDLLSSSDADYVNCDWVSGCSLMINLDNFTECPSFDSHYFLYYEDFDFCQRYLQEGHIIAITKAADVLHVPSSITNRNIFSKVNHSTYSYLLTLERYTSRFVFGLRLMRLLSLAIILILFKPQVSLGKLVGFWRFWKREKEDLR